MFLGLDGCSGGWLVCVGNDQVKFDFLETIEDCVNRYRDVESAFIDIPIGLPYPGVETRFCDSNSRKLLTRRRSSSIFPVPCRKAVYSDSYEAANKINKKVINKGLSKQSWNISGKIKEADMFLQENPDYKDILIESHPEVCFWALAGGKPMEFYKKTPKGERERIDILRKFIGDFNGILNSAREHLPAEKYVLDDLLDAAVLMVSARRSSHHYIEKFSENCERDERGLLMRIVYPPLKSQS